jgi:AcrR family transcriptional regulator
LRDGYEATSIRAVARAANLSDAAIYYYFRSKPELLEAVLEAQAAEAEDCRRHPGVCLTRQCLIECVLDYFYTYVGLPDLVRMLLREQIVNEPTSVASGMRIASRFPEVLGPAFERVYGARGRLLQETLDVLLAGILWNEILERGAQFSRAVASAAFRKRVRGLIELALPPARTPRVVSV